MDGADCSIFRRPAGECPGRRAPANPAGIGGFGGADGAQGKKAGVTPPGHFRASRERFSHFSPVRVRPAAFRGEGAASPTAKKPNRTAAHNSHSAPQFAGSGFAPAGVRLVGLSDEAARPTADGRRWGRAAQVILWCYISAITSGAAPANPPNALAGARPPPFFGFAGSWNFGRRSCVRPNPPPSLTFPIRAVFNSPRGMSGSRSAAAGVGQRIRARGGAGSGGGGREFPNTTARARRVQPRTGAQGKRFSARPSRFGGWEAGGAKRG